MADSFAAGGPIPFIAAGLLWVAAPVFSCWPCAAEEGPTMTAKQNSATEPEDAHTEDATIPTSATL